MNNIIYKVNCSFCNNIMYRRKYDLKRVKHGSFCSPNCKKLYWKQNKLYKESKPYRIIKLSDGRIKYYTGKSWSYRTLCKCTQCGKDIYREKPLEKNFCSNECKYIYSDPIGSKILEQKDNNSFYYLLGLIATDGCITYPTEKSPKVSYNVYIALKKEDRGVLDKIHDQFGGQLYEKKLISWHINNKGFIEYLKSIGLTRKKSQTMNVDKFFKSLNEIQKRHFIRGCVDGDGSVCIMKGNQLCISLVSGSYNFMKTITDHFQDILKSNKSIHEVENKTKKSKWYQMMFSFNQSIKLGHYLYNNITDNDLFIKRKYGNYMSIITNPKHLERIKKVLK